MSRIPESHDGLRIPARFAAKAMIDRFPDGSLRATALAWAAEPELGAYTAVICDGGAWHYFHFMEAMIWLWVIQHAFLGGVAPVRIVFTMPWGRDGENRVQIGVLGALYPGVVVLDPGDEWPATIDNVLIYDRSWAGQRLNKVLEACMGFAKPHVMEMGRRGRLFAGALNAAGARPRLEQHLVHVTRKPNRCFGAEALRELLAALRPFGPVMEVDFAAMPWDHQVRVAAAHDVMFGVHGNGLTNALWMRPGSLVLEFFSPGAHHYDYQFFAELCGLDYCGFDGEKVFPVFGRCGAPYGHGTVNDGAVTWVAEGKVLAVVEEWQRKNGNCSPPPPADQPSGIQ